MSIREFKKLLGLRQGQRRLKKWISNLPTDLAILHKPFTLFITAKTIMKLNLGHSDKFEIEI